MDVEALTHGDAMLKLKRVYEPVSRADGTRFLVERLWPRGVSKPALIVGPIPPFRFDHPCGR